jgi:hypothetical protein
MGGRTQPDTAPGEGAPPKRVQLSRAKGWRMPPGTVKVDRSTRWGNPFPIGGDYPTAAAAVSGSVQLSLAQCWTASNARRTRTPTAPSG